MRESMNEFYKKHKNLLEEAKFYFSEYYKFSFTFVSEVDDYRIIIECGGDADEIYNLNIGSNSPEQFLSLDPYDCTIYCNKEVVDSIYDY